MKITNTHKTTVGLPNGIMLEPGKPTLVRDWPEISKNLVVQAWVRAKILKVEEAEQPDPIKPDGDEKDELIAELKALGVKKDRKSSVEKLRALLEKAKAKADAGGDSEEETDDADDGDQTEDQV